MSNTKVFMRMIYNYKKSILPNLNPIKDLKDNFVLLNSNFSKFIFSILMNFTFFSVITNILKFFRTCMSMIDIFKKFSIINYSSLIFLIFLVKYTNLSNPDDSKFKSAILKNDGFYQNLHQEYSQFLRKYEKNSCIMNVFNNAKINCNDNNEKTNSFHAYKMTECFFESLGKNLPSCDVLQKNRISYSIKESEKKISFEEIKNCIKNLEGDAWTTFMNFQNHIDNLCFFHKTLLWEKSSEFLFSKMLNSTLGVLSELSNGSKLSNRILEEQEKFSSQLKTEMIDTLEEFKKIQNYFENLEKLEQKITSDVISLEDKIKSNNSKVENLIEKFNLKLEYISILMSKDNFFSMKFFIFLFLYIWILSFNKSINKIKIRLFILILFFLFFEKYFLNRIIKLSKNDNINVNFEERKLNENFYKNKNSDTNFENKEKLKFSYDFFMDMNSKFNELFSIENFLYFNFHNNLISTLIYYFFQGFYFSIINIICCLQIKSSKKKNKMNEIYTSSNIFEKIRDIKNLCDYTPQWMRKYFNKIKNNNEDMIERFENLKNNLNSISIENSKN